MATWTEPNAQETIPVAVDSSTKQYYAFKRDGSGNAVICSSSGEKGLGILQNKPKAGKGGLFFFGGPTKAIFGGTVNDGDNVTTDSAGKMIVTTTAGHYIFGQASGDWASGDIGVIQACVPWRLSS